MQNSMFHRHLKLKKQHPPPSLVKGTTSFIVFHTVVTQTIIVATKTNMEAAGVEPTVPRKAIMPVFSRVYSHC